MKFKKHNSYQKDAAIKDKLDNLESYFSKKFQKNKFDAALFCLPLTYNGIARKICLNALTEIRKLKSDLKSEKLTDSYYFYFNSRTYKDIINDFENEFFFEIEKMSKPDYELLEKLVSLNEEYSNKGFYARTFSKKERKCCDISSKLFEFLEKYENEGFSIKEYSYFNSRTKHQIKRDILKNRLEEKIKCIL